MLPAAEEIALLAKNQARRERTMTKSMRPTLSHMGIFVTDVERMVRFYTGVLGLTVTDRGQGMTFKNDLVFMSSDPEKHHEFVLASGRPKEATFSTVMQASFMVGSLDDLRAVKAKALAGGASDLRALDHGNAWSIYFKDPEGNTVEVYLDTPFHVPQPHGDPLDLGMSDAEILRTTEAACRNDPGFMPRADYVRRRSDTIR
jgi:catechol 2,3-dioxygenase